MALPATRKGDETTPSFRYVLKKWHGQDAHATFRQASTLIFHLELRAWRACRLHLTLSQGFFRDGFIFRDAYNFKSSPP